MCESNALLHTGAVQSALSESELRKKTAPQPETVTRAQPAHEFRIQIANGNPVEVEKKLLLRFFLAGRSFEQSFFIMPTTRMVAKGTSIFEIHFLIPDVINHLLLIPDCGCCCDLLLSEKVELKFLRLKSHVRLKNLVKSPVDMS